MGPTGGGDQCHPPRTVFQDADGGRADLHAPLGRRAGWVVFLFVLEGAAPVAYHLAAVTVDQERHHRVVEALAVVVQVEQRVDDGVAQAALFVQRLVGVGHVDSLVDEPGHQGPRAGVAAVREDLVRRLVPHVAAGAAVVVHHGLALDVVIRQHAEGRDDVLFEVLVLIVAPYQNEIGIEGVQFGPLLPEAGNQPVTVHPGGGNALVVAVFGAHRLRPSGGVFDLRRYPVAEQCPSQREGAVLVRGDQAGIVSNAYTQNFTHFNAPWLGYSGGLTTLTLKGVPGKATADMPTFLSKADA